MICAKNRMKKSEGGFTLVEVLASLVIITIILLGAYNLMIFTNKAAVSNNDRLVAINLGRATLERVKINWSAYFNDPSEIENLQDGQTYTSENCETDNCSDFYQITINDKVYTITLKISQNEKEKELQLVNTLVEIELSEENITHQVEGYVSYGSG